MQDKTIAKFVEMINHTIELPCFSESRNDARLTKERSRTIETTTSAKVSKSNAVEYRLYGRQTRVMMMNVIRRKVVPKT